MKTTTPRSATLREIGKLAIRKCYCILRFQGKPPLVGVGLTERAVRFLRESGELDWEIRDVPPAISRAGTIMRVAAGRDDIPCCAFVPTGDAPKLQAYLRWVESVTYPEVLQTLVDLPTGLLPMPLLARVLPNDSHRENLEGIRCNSPVTKVFRFYLVPLRAGDVHTYGLISAFFDDHDEPLTISTLLFDEEESHEIFRVLSSDSFDMFSLTNTTES